jgi:hypothetical protein
MGGENVQLHSSFISALDKRLAINLRLRPLYPQEKTLVPTDTHFIELGLVSIYFVTGIFH